MGGDNEAEPEGVGIPDAAGTRIADETQSQNRP